MRTLKTLGLTLGALLAMSGLFASGAQALKFTVGNGATRTTFSKVKPLTFLYESGEVECGEESGEGSSASETTEEFVEEPIDGECEGQGFPIDTKMNKCTYDWTANGEVHLCATGGPIETTLTSGGLSVCTITIAKQTVKGVVYDNSGTPAAMDILVTMNVKGVTYTVDGGKGKCGKEGLHPGGGQIIVETTLKAEDNNKNQKSLTVS
jgi:hypothetical protein